MTCIAGICDGKNVWIGGDSAGVGGYNLTIRKDEKVFKRHEFVFGFTSSFRMGQLLRYSLNVPPLAETQDVYGYMVTTFIDAVRHCLKSGGYAEKQSEKEYGGIFLVGFRGQLYKIDVDYQVAIPSESFDACGCGESFALGSLHETHRFTPEVRIKKALQVAEKCSAGVRSPFVIVGTQS